MKIVTIVCEFCKNSFTVEKSRSRPNKYCSKKCKCAVVRVKYQEGLKKGIIFGRPVLEHFYIKYLSGAKKKGNSFTLTQEEFNTFYQKSCHYCGASIVTVGIDRMDNSIGYELSNCVPCCTTCNKMKRDMEYEEFINHCKRIASAFKIVPTN